MKYFFFLLFSASVFAGPAITPPRSPTITEWMTSEYKQHNGVIYYRVTMDTIRWCFTQTVDNIISIPDAWQSAAVATAAMVVLTPEQFQVCNDTLPPAIWKVAPNPSAVDIPPTRPLKDAAMKDRWRIAVGMPCEDVTINVINAKGSEYHWAANNSGQRGITVCVKQ